MCKKMANFRRKILTILPIKTTKTVFKIPKTTFMIIIILEKSFKVRMTNPQILDKLHR